MYQVPLGGIGFTSNVGSLGTNINASNASINNLSVTSATIGQLKTAIFEPITLNTSVINASQLNLPHDYIIPFLNVSQLTAFTESFVDLSAVNVSATSITATSVTAHNVQPTLTAGNNIDICGNVISSTGILPSIGNFTEINTSTINASNLSTADLSIGSNLTLTNKLLKVNSTANVTQNSADLITSGAVYSAFNGTGGGDSRSLTNTQLYLGGDIIKPIVSGTVNTVNVNIPPNTTRNMMKIFYTTKFGANAILNCTCSFSYEMAGYGGDNVNARLIYNNGVDNTISRQEQIWIDHEGGGTRSGVLSPRIGNRTSAVSAGTTVYFQLLIDNNSSNDTWTMLFPDSCTFQITETLDNDGGNDLNLNTGDIQADSAIFNSLNIQAGSSAGQAVIGRTQIGNDAFSNMMALSINGNTGATNYGFAQIANNQTIMNAQSTSTYNSFRVQNQEIASINDVGLGIGYPTGDTAFFPLCVNGDALIENILFADEVDANSVKTNNLSSDNFSTTNATIDNLTITGTITADTFNFSTGNLIPGDNITIVDDVISAFIGSDSIVNINTLHSGGNVDVVGALNVCETSTFGGSLNVSNIIYAGVAGQHEGGLVLYSNVVGNNFTQTYDSSGDEVYITATGSATAINYFVGGTNVLRISTGTFEVFNLEADDINAETLNVVELETEVFECIDGKATFRFTTPLLNATTANISTLTLDELQLNELDIDEANFSTYNFIVGVGDELDVNTLTATLANINTINVSNANFGSITASGVGNFSTLNASNLSTATMRFSSDFFLDRFSNTLNFVGESAAQVIEELEDNGLTTVSINTVSLTVSGFSNVNVLGVGLLLTSTTNFLYNINSSGRWNTSTLNVSTINASNIVGYQEELIAGTNITIVGNTISSAGEPLPSNANFSTITSQTTNTSTLNTSFITCIDEASFSNGITASGIVSCDQLDTDEIFTIDTNSTRTNTSSIGAFVYNISDNLDDTEASTLIRNGSLTEFIHTAGRLRFSCNEIQTSGVANFSTLNASNLSTATMGLSTDFELNTFNNQLTFIGTTGSQAIQSLEDDGLTTTILVSGLLTVTNFANINTGNFSTIDVISGNIDTLTNEKITSTNRIIINNTSPTLYLKDTDAKSGMIHMNANRMYFLSGGTNSESWSQVNGQWPLYLQTNTNEAFFGGDIDTPSSVFANNFISPNANISTCNVSTVNASVINGANLSTATMRLSSDFSLDTFNNTLNFEGETGADAVRDLEDNGLTTVSIDTDSLTVSGFSNVNVLGVGLLLSSATNFLYNINSSGTWNTSTLNVSTINASSITGYQQSLIAGTGITLNGNTISVTDPLPTDANFSSVNTSTLNTSTINASSAIIDSMTVNDMIIDNDDSTDYALKILNGTAFFSSINVSQNFTFTGSNFFIGNVAAPSANKLWFYSATQPEIGMTLGITSSNEAELEVKSEFSDVDVFNINFGGTKVIELDNVSTQINNTLNVSEANFSTINASNIVGYQKELIAGTNITITGNTISSAGDPLPTNANFSSVNTSTLNTSTINASNIVGYQEPLTCGDKPVTNLQATTISSADEPLPTNANFSSVNTSTLNTSTIDSSGRVDIGSANGQSKGLVLTGNSPTITLKDTDARSGMIHMNDNNMYFLSGVSNSEAWTQVNGQWPLILDTSTNVAQFGGNITSPNWNVLKPVFNLTNRFPNSSGATQVTVATSVVITGNFILHYYNSGFKTSAGLGIFQLYAVPNAGGTNILIGNLRQYWNSTSFHLSFSQSNYVTNVAAGTYSLLLTRDTTALRHDTNDFLTVIMEMVPF